MFRVDPNNGVDTVDDLQMPNSLFWGMLNGYMKDVSPKDQSTSLAMRHRFSHLFYHIISSNKRKTKHKKKSDESIIIPQLYSMCVLMVSRHLDEEQKALSLFHKVLQLRLDRLLCGFNHFLIRERRQRHMYRSEHR